MDVGASELLGTLLQRILVRGRSDRMSLYWYVTTPQPGPIARAKLACQFDKLVVAHGTTLSFDTYFNSFFEPQWRRHTSLGPVVLRLTVEGTGILRVFRRALGRNLLVLERRLIAGLTTVSLPADAVTFRQYGTLYMELEAETSDLVFVAGGWWSDTPAPTHVGLAAIFCTFGRELEITRLVDRLAVDPAIKATLVRLIVVKQGEPGLADQPVIQDAALSLGEKLVIVDQANFGGARGFGRGILIALDDPAATHAVLLDDDILIEPDSLLRMAAFFTFCDRDILIGGHMLDLVQPHLLYEAGAIVSDRHWEFKPQHNGLALDEPEALEALSLPGAVHYNGWWCCGFPLRVVDEHGMPLPCFIRGDDVEFGLRLHMQGIATVPMPGIAVWHEPFYLKLGSWQRYYETRNLLIAASLHLAPSRLGAVRRIGRHVVMNLLTFRYYTAALILAGTEAFLEGPEALHANPAKLHASLAAFRTAYPAEITSRETVLEPQAPSASPKTRFGCIALLSRPCCYAIRWFRRGGRKRDYSTPLDSAGLQCGMSSTSRLKLGGMTIYQPSADHGNTTAPYFARRSRRCGACIAGFPRQRRAGSLICRCLRRTSSGAITWSYRSEPLRRKRAWATQCPVPLKRLPASTCMA